MPDSQFENFNHQIVANLTQNATNGKISQMRTKVEFFEKFGFF